MLRSAAAALLLLAHRRSLSRDAAARPQRPEATLQHWRGGAYIPDYEGSDDYEFTPFAGIRGRVSRIDFFSRGTYLYVDFVPRGDERMEFDPARSSAFE